MPHIKYFRLIWAPCLSDLHYSTIENSILGAHLRDFALYCCRHFTHHICCLMNLCAHVGLYHLFDRLANLPLNILRIGIVVQECWSWLILIFVFRILVVVLLVVMVAMFFWVKVSKQIAVFINPRYEIIAHLAWLLKLHIQRHPTNSRNACAANIIMQTKNPGASIIILEFVRLLSACLKFALWH